MTGEGAWPSMRWMVVTERVLVATRHLETTMRANEKTQLISHLFPTLFDSHTFHLVPSVTMLRLTNTARTTIRQLSTSAVRREEAAAVGTVGAVPVKRPVGGFR